MRSRPTAGQASAEYVAALALVAAALALASPAVGAPNVAGIVAHKLRLGICLVAADVCSDDAARAAGLAPCPLRSDTTGWDGYVTVFSAEVGGKWTLTVTRRSDGSVSVVRTAGAHKGGSVGIGVSAGAGPIVFDVGASGSARRRIQAARAWEFPDQATADRFLKHSLRNAIDEDRWPAAWHSVEKGDEVAAMVGAAGRAEGYRDRGDLLGFAGSWQDADGARRTRDGDITLYSRTALDGPEASVPLLPSLGRGRDEWMVEYTFGRDGPRELVFRRARPEAHGDRVVETVARLDLRDPANLEAARPLLSQGLPWPPGTGPRKRAVLDRIASHGVVEHAVYALDDASTGVSGSVRGGLKFGAGGRKIEVHKRLVEAGARTGGSSERERFDCVDQG